MVTQESCEGLYVDRQTSCLSIVLFVRESASSLHFVVYSTSRPSEATSAPAETPTPNPTSSGHGGLPNSYSCFPSEEGWCADMWLHGKEIHCDAEVAIKPRDGIEMSGIIVVGSGDNNTTSAVCAQTFIRWQDGSIWQKIHTSYMQHRILSKQPYVPMTVVFGLVVYRISQLFVLFCLQLFRICTDGTYSRFMTTISRRKWVLSTTHNKKTDIEQEQADDAIYNV